MTFILRNIGDDGQRQSIPIGLLGATLLEAESRFRPLCRVMGMYVELTGLFRSKSSRAKLEQP